MQITTSMLAAAAIAFVVAGTARAADMTAGELTIHDPWARATVGAGAGAAFLEIRNVGEHDDRLVSADAEIAQRTELHTHVRDGDVMRMRQVEAIDLPAGATTKLEPGGLHVMLLGMSEPLAAGTQFPLTLSFAEAGAVTVQVQVKDVGAMGGHSMMKHNAQ